jgi:SAM-dependent methyltransferase
MFSKTAHYYDEIYAALGKDYAREVAHVRRLILKHKRSSGKTLLGVACGTGKHAGLLSRHFQVTGLDLDAHMLAVARRNHPHIRFHRGDMAAFKLDRRFDAIVCLFSSIGYARTAARLHSALKTMSNHLVPGGVIVLEPWFSLRQWHVGRTGMVVVDNRLVKIVRFSHAARRGKLSILNLEYLISTPDGISHAVERHELGLFSKAEYLHAFRQAGLHVTYDPRGLTGRGLYLGLKPG